MRYALISDIHGNYPALKAVLEDAARQNIQRYLFIGDYVQDLPWPNETVDAVRRLETAVVVRGNKEEYLRNLHAADQSAWTDEQFAPLYWNYRTLDKDNLDYLLSLPEKAEISDEAGGAIYLEHKSDLFLGEWKLPEFRSSHYAMKMKEAPMTHEDYLAYARSAVHNNAKVVDSLKTQSGGAVVFGHNHLQWHMTLGDTLYVNPGSCGLPLDFNTDAPYTVIEFAGGAWRATERRVTYDVGAVIRGLTDSTLYRQAGIWSEIITESLLNAEDTIGQFFRVVTALADARGERAKPVGNETWRLAYAQWKAGRAGCAVS